MSKADVERIERYVSSGFWLCENSHGNQVWKIDFSCKVEKRIREERFAHFGSWISKFYYAQTACDWFYTRQGQQLTHWPRGSMLANHSKAGARISRTRRISSYLDDLRLPVL